MGGKGFEDGGMGGVHLTARRGQHSKQKERRLQALEALGGHLHEEMVGKHQAQ